MNPNNPENEPMFELMSDSELHEHDKFRCYKCGETFHTCEAKDDDHGDKMCGDCYELHGKPMNQLAEYEFKTRITNNMIMENRNLVNLDPYFLTIDGLFKSQKIIHRRTEAFFKWLSSILPYDIKGQYSFDDIGETTIRCFVYLGANEESTLRLLNWLPQLKDKRVVVEKFWRKNDGYFTYKIERKYKYPGPSYILMFEEGANIDGCKINKKRKMTTFYETDCETDRILIK